jgi:SET domain-containing protein
MAQFINHPCDPNVQFRLEGETVWCEAIRSILLAEELSLDYKFSKDSDDHLLLRPTEMPWEDK